MSEKMGDKIAFWLALVSTEFVLYSLILLGIAGIFLGMFGTTPLVPIAVVATMVEAFSIWRKHEQGIYAESYRKHVCKEDMM